MPKKRKSSKKKSARIDYDKDISIPTTPEKLTQLVVKGYGVDKSKRKDTRMK